MMDPRFRCCFCFHVRTGTICVGIYNMILQAGTILLLLFATTNPDFMSSMLGNVRENSNDAAAAATQSPPTSTSTSISTAPPQMDSATTVENNDQSFLAMQTLFPSMHSVMPVAAPPSAASSSPPQRTRARIFNGADVRNGRTADTGDIELGLALLLGLFFITALMVCGAIKGRPMYILPFFCFQLFDFLLACLTAWMPNLQQIAQEHPDMPFRDRVLQLDGQLVALLVSAAYIVMLIAKAYFIGVLWACYQYLRLRQENVRAYTAGDGYQCDYEMLLPPAYDEALKMSPMYAARDMPPPPYVTNESE